MGERSIATHAACPQKGMDEDFHLLWGESNPSHVAAAVLELVRKVSRRSADAATHIKHLGGLVGAGPLVHLLDEARRKGGSVRAAAIGRETGLGISTGT